MLCLELGKTDFFQTMKPFLMDQSGEDWGNHAEKRKTEIMSYCDLLFNYLDRLSDDLNEKITFDGIAFRCEYSLLSYRELSEEMTAIENKEIDIDQDNLFELFDNTFYETNLYMDIVNHNDNDNYILYRSI